MALKEGPAVEIASSHCEVGVGVEPVAQRVDVFLRGSREPASSVGLKYLERLDANDLRTPVGQITRGVGTGENKCQVSDTDALKGALQILGF